MELFRITRQKYLTNYTGRGASFLHGARWNKSGQPVLYFATTPAVAQLEMANYIPSPRLVPEDYRLGIYTLPPAVSTETISVNELPDDWSHFPYPESTQTIGSKWLDSGRTLVLFVPSTAVPGGRENIAVVNPLHPEISNLSLVATESKIYNSRTFQGF